MIEITLAVALGIVLAPALQKMLPYLVLIGALLYVVSLIGLPSLLVIGGLSVGLLALVGMLYC